MNAGVVRTPILASSDHQWTLQGHLGPCLGSRAQGYSSDSGVLERNLINEPVPMSNQLPEDELKGPVCSLLLSKMLSNDRDKDRS